MKLAVYGSLRKGMPAHRLLSSSKFVGEGKIHGALFDLGWFPGVKQDNVKHDETVVVEVWDVDDFAPIDIFEGYREDAPDLSLFVRKTTKELTSQEEVFVYTYNQSLRADTPQVFSGDWKDYYERCK